jgi:hypothetical protein
MTKTGPVTPAELELWRRLMAIGDRSRHEVIEPRWLDLHREVNAKIANGAPGDVLVPIFWEAWRAFERDLDAIEVPRVETEADLPHLETVFAKNVEAILGKATSKVRTELARWGTAT